MTIGHSASEQVLLHISGLDQPGVTASLTCILADEGAKLVSIGQSVLEGYLTLSALVQIQPGSDVLRKLLVSVSKQGLRLEIGTINSTTTTNETQTSTTSHGENDSKQQKNALCITMIGEHLSDGKATSALTQFLAKRSLTIEQIRTLSDKNLSGIEIISKPAIHEGNEKASSNNSSDVDSSTQDMSNASLADLRKQILALGKTLDADVAVQRDDIFRRNKRLVCLDVDSTFAQGEFIDELAAALGVKEQVAAITKRAMRGEIDFRSALSERVALLKGLPLEKMMTVVRETKLTPGAAPFVKTLKALGFHVGLVSGGFDCFVGDLKERHGLDFAFANALEVADGKLTGRTTGTIVDSERKAQVLRDMCQVYSCRIEQSVAVGDGANDINMLEAAGLGIAFRGKPALQDVADLSLNHSHRLDVIFYLMGFNAKELRELEL